MTIFVKNEKLYNALKSENKNTTMSAKEYIEIYTNRRISEVWTNFYTYAKKNIKVKQIESVKIGDNIWVYTNLTYNKATGNISIYSNFRIRNYKKKLK